MKEIQLNTIISRSIKKIGWYHKISDPLGGTGIQNPFDGFGVINGYPLYIEAKLIKNGIYAFNFNKIEEHQITNLNEINKMLSISKCLIAVGFYKPRQLCEICFFDIDYINQLMADEVKSIKKKQLEQYRDKGFFMKINYVEEGNKRRQYIDLSKLSNLEDFIIDGRN
jgi:penicillin-binding protein-related factor A (putative recombinase)